MLVSSATIPTVASAASTPAASSQRVERRLRGAGAAGSDWGGTVAIVVGSPVGGGGSPDPVAHVVVAARAQHLRGRVVLRAFRGGGAVLHGVGDLRVAVPAGVLGDLA